MIQKDLDGKENMIQPEEKVSISKIYRTEFFKITVPESTNVSGMVGTKKRKWIMQHMKPCAIPKEGTEGEAFQADLDKLCRDV